MDVENSNSNTNTEENSNINTENMNGQPQNVTNGQNNKFNHKWWMMVTVKRS